MNRSLLILSGLMIGAYAWGDSPRVLRAEGARARLEEQRSQEGVKTLGRGAGINVPRERKARVPRETKNRDLATELLSAITLPTPLVYEVEPPKPPKGATPFTTVIEGSFPSDKGSDTPAKGPVIPPAGSQTPASGPTSIGFNDAAPEGRDSVQIPTNQNNRKGPANSGGGGGTGGGAQALPKWFALCMLIDPDIPDGNAIVKGVVEHAAKCGVVMEVFPFTIRQNYPNDPGSINSMAKKACNLPDVLGIENTAVSTVVRFTDTAGIMCGETENPESVAGCSEVGGGPKGGGGSAKDRKEKLDRMKASGHSGGEASGGVAANIVVRQGADADTAMHEIGHGILAEENGSRIGLGLGKGGGGGGGSGFNAEGCAIFQSSAFDNDGTHFYDPSRETYYVKVENERFQRDLTQNRSFFGEGPPGLPPIPPAPPQRPPGGELPIGGAPPSKATPPARPPLLSSIPPTNSTAVNSNSVFELSGGTDSTHKKNGGSLNLAGEGGKESALNSDQEFFGPTEEGSTTITKSVGFNDKAEEEDEALTEQFFEGTEKDTKNDKPAERLLSSLGPEAGDKSKRSGPTLESESGEGTPGKSGAESAGPEGPSSDEKPYTFDTNSDENFFDYVAKKTKDILDSEFFNGVIPAKSQNEPARKERDIRIIKGIY